MCGEGEGICMICCSCNKKLLPQKNGVMRVQRNESGEITCIWNCDLFVCGCGTQVLANEGYGINQTYQEFEGIKESIDNGTVECLVFG